MVCHVTKINIIKQSNKQILIALFYKNLKAFETITLPVQSCPSPINPGLHMHTYDPCVLLHVASLWHLSMNESHLSVVKLERKKYKKNYMNKYQLQI